MTELAEVVTFWMQRYEGTMEAACRAPGSKNDWPGLSAGAAPTRRSPDCYGIKVSVDLRTEEM